MKKSEKMIEFNEQIEDIVEYQHITLDSLLLNLPSVLTLDVAPKHTGIVYWDGKNVTTYHFKLQEPNKQDPHWLYQLRREFKDNLKEIVKGQHYTHCLIEDVYGGENYDTVIQLLIINTVIDELIDEKVCSVDNFYRLNATSWMAKARLVYKQEGKLKSKIETQGLLDYLDCQYYKDNKDLSDEEKKEICFEDVCDAYGMLIAVASMMKLVKQTKQKKQGIRFGDVKMLYIEHLEDCKTNRDKRFKTEEKEQIELKKNIKDSIVEILEDDKENKVYYAKLPVSKLGAFGMKYGFTFFASGQGYLLFYLKQSKK